MLSGLPRLKPKPSWPRPKAELRDLRQTSVAIVVSFLKLIQRQKVAGNASLAADLKQFLDDHYLHDEHEYAAAARCVVDDPATFGV